MTNIPHYGVIEFDYVSTTRPRARESVSAGTNVQNGLLDTITSPRSSLHVRKYLETPSSSVVSSPTSINLSYNPDFSNQDGSIRPFSSNKFLATSPSNGRPTSKKDSSRIISDEDFHQLITRLGIEIFSSNIQSKRPIKVTEELVSTRNAVLILVELQHAAAKYYFPCSKVIKLLELFPQDVTTQAKVNHHCY